MSDERKIRRVLRQTATHYELTDAELAAGRELERRADIARLDADVAAADVENYYDQFAARAFETTTLERAEKFAEDFWAKRGLTIGEKPSSPR